MEEDFEGFDRDDEFQDHLTRFISAQEQGMDVFFDASDIADIASYFTDEGDFDSARKALDIAKAQHPLSAEVLMAEGRYFLSMDVPEVASKLVDEVLKLDPYNADALILRASISSRQELYTEAIGYLRRAIPHCEDFVTDVYLDLAFACQGNKDYEQSVFWLKRILKEEPDNEAALFELLFLYDLMDDIKGYVDFLKKYLDDQPYSWLAWYNLGVTYMKISKYKKAIDAFSYTTAINENFAPAWYNLANSHVSLGQYKKALENFFESLEFDKPTVDVLTMMGECYEKLNKFDEAENMYQRAIDLNKDYPDAWIGLGVVHGLKENPTKGISYIERGLELDMLNSLSWHVYAEVLEQAGKVEEAEFAYLRSITLDPDNKEVWLDYTHFLSVAHSPAKAVEVIEEALNVFPEDDILLYRLVAYQLNSGKKQAALQNLEHALSLNFDAHEDLIDYFPEALNNNAVAEMLEIYRKNEF